MVMGDVQGLEGPEGALGSAWGCQEGLSGGGDI